MDQQPHHTTLQGHEVVDAHGQKLGVVTDVVYAETVNEPELIVVDPGLLSRSHFVPAEGAEVREDGEIVVPYDKDQVKSSPKAKKDHVLSGHEIAEVKQHYGAGRD